MVEYSVNDLNVEAKRMARNYAIENKIKLGMRKPWWTIAPITGGMALTVCFEDTKGNKHFTNQAL